MTQYILAIDQGTTGSTVLLIDHEGRLAGKAYSEFTQHYPQPGWVEHDANEIWRITEALIEQITRPLTAGAVVAVGITNQRETTVVWDRQTGEPIHRAIVWQCRRTADRCNELREAGHAELFRNKTGLVLDAYFSGTKIAWILDQVEGARARAEKGELAFGTIDSWLIWKLTGGAAHVTDYTNASRTLLYNIFERKWDDTLLETLRVPAQVLPEVRPSSGKLATTRILGQPVPISGVAGDQQSALFGQLCHAPGQIKNTYGTGCFMLMPTAGETLSQSGLLTTLAVSAEGQPTYALEGSVFIAGAAIQWLRDELGLIKDAPESEPIAAALEDSQGVYLVPAFTGLGAPYWDMDARGAIVGLTRGSGRAQIVRAALESIAYQSRDLAEAFASDAGAALDVLRVDGGACANNFLMQFQADIGRPPRDHRDDRPRRRPARRPRCRLLERRQRTEPGPPDRPHLRTTDVGRPARRAVRGLAQGGLARALAGSCSFQQTGCDAPLRALSLPQIPQIGLTQCPPGQSA